jgi:hypothetical protein
VEGQKAVKEAAVLFNALIAEQWCRVIRQRDPHGVYRLLSLSWLRSLGKKARSWHLGLTQNTIVYHAPFTVESLMLELRASATQKLVEEDTKQRLLFCLVPYKREVLFVSL